MKTVSCEQKITTCNTQKINNDSEFPVDSTLVTVELKTVLNKTRPSDFHQYVSTENSLLFNNSSESDHLLVCNSHQVGRLNFQNLKVAQGKQKLNPGIYLQKVFLNGVTQKFKSQSLPNCLESKKCAKNCHLDNFGDAQEITAPLVSPNNVHVINDTTFANDNLTHSWFKTWPERSGEKLASNNESTQNVDNAKVPSIPILTSDKSVVIEDKETQRFEDLFNGKSQNLIINHKSYIGPNEQQVTLRDCQSNNNGNRIEFKEINESDSENCEYATSIKSIPLDRLLDNIPLAYSPFTKQLHLISNPKENVKNCDIPCMANNEVFQANLNLRNKVNTVSNLEEDTCKSGRKKDWPLNSLKDSEPEGAAHANNVHCAELNSFSSTVSSLSDNSPSTNEDSALGSLLDQGDTCSIVSLGSCSAFSEDSIGEQSQKRSLTGFFSRKVFNWKSISRSDNRVKRGGGWKIFSKNSSPGSSHTSLSTDHESEVVPDSPRSVRSSSALIQLARPAHLPAKTPEEEARHRQEYQQMVDAARNKEVKEAKQKRKQQQEQLRTEEQLAHATRVWTHEILPSWQQMHNSKKVRELWWQGVPPCVRGKVWQLAIGNALHLTHSVYDTCVRRAQDSLRGESGFCCGGCEGDSGCVVDSSERSMQQIQLDISRTFPHLCIFQKGGPYYDTLHWLLAAYVCYRPNVGYVQGMSFIAAVLILNMEPADAFVCFANLLNRPCHMAFFQVNQQQMQAYYSTYDELLRYNLPQLSAHLTSTALSPDLYLLDWIYTVFSKAMNLDLACRVWDVFLRDGDQFLIRTALGVLHMYQELLLKMDFVVGSQFLTKLPDDLSGDKLFRSISCIKMAIGKATFEDILVTNSANC